MTTLNSITTAEQLYAAGDIGRCELVGGELKTMTPPGYEHGRIAARITAKLFNFVDERDLGDVVTDDTGFILSRNPDTVRGPDCAFVSKARIKSVRPVKGYGVGAPDLVVEVNSPTDLEPQVLLKVRQWLDAGCVLVVVVDPELKIIKVHQAHAVRALGMEDVLTLESVLHGFSIRVSEIFR